MVFVQVLKTCAQKYKLCIDVQVGSKCEAADAPVEILLPRCTSKSTHSCT